MEKIIIILGPTGTGKTSLALQIARRLGTEIISADSRQVYKHADVGTNKIPSGSEYVKKDNFWIIDDVTVNLYDVVTPNEEYSVARFVKDAQALITQMWGQNIVPIVVGGTGFYIDALIGRSGFSTVPHNKEKRKTWNALSTEEMYGLLQKLDNRFAAKLSSDTQKNKQRLIRYCELALDAGSVKGAIEWSQLKNEVEILWIGLTADREVLYQRSDVWVNEIFKQGLDAEVEQLLSDGFRDTQLMRGMIYAPTVALSDGQISVGIAKKEIKHQMHAYIRRQLTWFRRNDDVQWFDVNDPMYGQAIHELVKSFI